jgi:positive regulator of sigma E activity
MGRNAVDFAKLSVLLLIAFVLLLALVLVNIYAARHKPNKLRYRVVLVLCFYILGSGVGIFDHLIWSISIMVVATILGFVLLRGMPESVRLEEAEDTRTIDLSAPICAKDFFSAGLLIKLERKYGVQKARVIYLLPVLVLLVISVYLTGLAINWITEPLYTDLSWIVPINTGVVTFLLIIRNYRDTKKAIDASQQGTP